MKVLCVCVCACVREREGERDTVSVFSNLPLLRFRQTFGWADGRSAPWLSDVILSLFGIMQSYNKQYFNCLPAYSSITRQLMSTVCIDMRKVLKKIDGCVTSPLHPLYHYLNVFFLYFQGTTWGAMAKQLTSILKQQNWFRKPMVTSPSKSISLFSNFHREGR